jgi:hypothetical protein
MSPKICVQDDNFYEVKESARVDERGRLTLGPEAKFKTYKVMVNKAGQILLDPVVSIPERELWLWQNESARNSLRRGLEQAESGELHDLGSFAEDADLEIED